MLTTADLKQEIKHHYSADVFHKYIGKVNRKAILSPLRNEKHPSFCLYKDKQTGEMKFKDFGSGEGGDCIDFVCQLKGIEFNDAVTEICQEFQIQEVRVNGKEVKPISNYSYEIKNFSESELAYWNQYGITADVLAANNVFSLTSFTAEVKGQDRTSYYNEANPIFAYCFADSVKLYRPLNDKGHRFGWLGNKPADYIFGYNTLPKQGRSVIITAGEKDVLSLKAKEYNAICLNSETANLPEHIAAELGKRFTNIFVLYDNDRTGNDNADKLCKQYSFTKIQLPEMGINRKDISDYFYLGHTQFDFELLIEKSLNAKFKDVLDELGNELFDPTYEYKEPTAVISINGETVATGGNIITLLGQSKSGKSGVCGAILAGSIALPSLPIDTLGIRMLQNKDHKAVLHFDTEQSEADWRKFGHRVLRRAIRTDKPDYYYSIHLRKHDIRTRLERVEKYIKAFAEKHNGIYLVVIDGIADLVTSVNEEKECYQLIDRLMQIAGQYDFPIVTILHLNPGMQPGTVSKGRGHLGSHLERKSESVLSICKEGDISRLEPIHLRNASPVDMPTLLFKYDTQKGYPVSLGELKNKQVQKEENFREMAVEIYSEYQELKNIELIKILMDGKNVSRRTAIDYINIMCDMGFLIKGEGKFGTYVLSSNLKQSAESADNLTEYDDEVPF